MQQQRAPASTKQQPTAIRELLKKARQHVKEAIKEKKIFSVQGPYPVMRKLLRARGWVERKLSTDSKVGTRSLQEEKQEDAGGEDQWEAALHAEPGAENLVPPEEEEEEEEEGQGCTEDPDGIHDIMSSMVRDQMPTFIWTAQTSAVCYQELQKHQIVNHFTGTGAFTTKKGLCMSLENLPSLYQADPTTFFPRCYRLGDEDERQAFIEDFHLTAARSLLKLAVEKAGIMPGVMEPPGKGAGPASPSPPELLEKALQLCRMQLDTLEHRDIDSDSPLLDVTDASWDRFLHEYYRVVNQQARLKPSVPQRKQCRALLQKLQRRLPQLHMEGVHNLWIIKPAAMSRGRGITCSARLEEVLQLPGEHTEPSLRSQQWIAQKYVERPLLIFGTKIDLRQWILVTDWNPLTIWFYRDSYVRFCSQPFSLHHLHASRHLCNVSIQKQWRRAGGRDPRLPCDLVWSSHHFQRHLQEMGHTKAWENVIVPGMKEAVVAALQSGRELVEDRKGSFELYGADFMFGEDCQPWLLEINCSPTMAPCSAVTRRLCAAVQRDILRVVLDHRDNPACSTGAFELIYKEAAVPMPRCRGLNLAVKGYSIMKPKLQKEQPKDKLHTTLPLALPVVPKSLGVAKPLGETRCPVVTLPPTEPWPPAAHRLTVVSEAGTDTKLPALPRPAVISTTLTDTKPPVVPRPPVVPKPLRETRHPGVTLPPIEPRPPVAPRLPVVSEPHMDTKLPALPRPVVLSTTLMDTKPIWVPRPPVVPKPLREARCPGVTLTPRAPRTQVVSGPRQCQGPGTTMTSPP